MAELVPSDVRAVWGELMRCRVAERERLAEARMWRRKNLPAMRYYALMAALAFRAKRRELAKGLVTR
jgi:hypothetical protein